MTMGLRTTHPGADSGTATPAPSTSALAVPTASANWPAHLVLSLARAVSADNRCVVIDHDNNGIGWTPIEDVAGTRQALAVRVQGNVLALEADALARSGAPA